MLWVKVSLSPLSIIHAYVDLGTLCVYRGSLRTSPTGELACEEVRRVQWQAKQDNECESHRQFWFKSATNQFCVARYCGVDTYVHVFWRFLVFAVLNLFLHTHVL